MTTVRCILLFILLLIPATATAEPNWYHETCNHLVESFTWYKEDLMNKRKIHFDYVRKQKDIWVQIQRECKTSCFGHHDELTKRLQRLVKDYWRSQKNIKESNEAYAKDFQGWIDFMGECLKSIEKS